MVISNVSPNLVHANSQIGGVREISTSNHGRGCMNLGRGSGHGCSSSRYRETCQICRKYGHFVVDYCHRFDETFTHTNASSNIPESSFSIDQDEASTLNKNDIAMMAYLHDYYLS